MIYKDKRVVQIPVDEFLALLGLTGWELETINKFDHSDQSVSLVVMKDWIPAPPDRSAPGEGT